METWRSDAVLGQETGTIGGHQRRIEGTMHLPITSSMLPSITPYKATNPLQPRNVVNGGGIKGGGLSIYPFVGRNETAL